MREKLQRILRTLFPSLAVYSNTVNKWLKLKKYLYNYNELYK